MAPPESGLGGAGVALKTGLKIPIHHCGRSSILFTLCSHTLWFRNQWAPCLGLRNRLGKNENDLLPYKRSNADILVNIWPVDAIPVR